MPQSTIVRINGSANGTFKDDFETKVSTTFTDILPDHGYPLRQNQLRMARSVARALLNKRVLLADAGVGIGKSFAYLIPILLRGRGVYIISTSTLVLQDQLKRDVERLIDILKIDPPPQIIVSRGQEHYVCRQRVGYLTAHEQENPELSDYAKQLYKQLNSMQYQRGIQGLKDNFWEEETMSALGVPAEFQPYLAVSRRQRYRHVPKSDCPNCVHKGVCGFWQMHEARKHAVGWVLILVTHGLLLQDLALRMDGNPPLWTWPDAIVIDEAHDLEPKTRSILTMRLNPKQFERIVDRSPEATRRAQRMLAVLQQLQAAMKEARRKSKDPLADRIALTDEVWDALRELKNLVDEAYAAASYKSWSYRGTRETTYIQYLDYWQSALQEVFRSQADNVVAIEGVEITVSPGTVGHWLNRALFQFSLPVILCSGTLLAGASFEEVEKELGIPPARADRFQAASPFNYPKRMVILSSPDFAPVPMLGSPKEQEYFESFLFPTLNKLLRASKGRALILSTSRMRARAIYEYLKQSCPYNMLWQDDLHAVEQFRQDTHSVLVGTGRLFTGIDVPGESLSLVVLDRIPFPVPHDPLYQVKEQLALKAGKSRRDARWAWARTTLVQAAGRLIRTVDDWGVFALLDPRAGEGGRYHTKVRSVLPPGRWVSSLKEVQEFFARGPQENVEAPKDLEFDNLRFAWGFGPDVVEMLRREDSQVRPFVQDPRRPNETDVEGPVVLCAGDPEIAERIRHYAGQGHEVVVAALRGQRWGSLLQERLQCAHAQLAYPPMVNVPFFVGIVQKEDELTTDDLIEYFAYVGNSFNRLLIFGDITHYNQAQSRLRKAKNIDKEHVKLTTWKNVIEDVDMALSADIAAVVTLPRGPRVAGKTTFARLISLLTFDGRPRCLLVPALEEEWVGDLRDVLNSAGIKLGTVSEALRALREAGQKQVNCRTHV